MPRYRLLAIAATCFAVLASNTAGAVDMQEGLWEITTRVEMPGMPAGMGNTTMQHCFTKQDVQDPRAAMPKDDRCTFSDLRTSGNTASWTVQCKGEEPMKGTGSVTYRGSSYDGTMTVQMSEDGQTMTMKQHFSGRRLGPCR